MEISYFFVNASENEDALLQGLSFVDVNGMQTLHVNSWNNSARATERENDELYPVPAYLIVLLSFAYGLIAAVAVVGNAVVLVAIGHSRNMHTVTNFFIALLCVCMCILFGKAVPEMAYTVSGGTLNPTHSLTSRAMRRPMYLKMKSRRR